MMKHVSMNRVWAGFFTVWTLLLTGTLGFWLKSPGMKQWYSVNHSLQEKRHEIGDIEAHSILLSHAAHQLEFNSVAQEREIRKVLGYLGDQELVFEFQSRQ